ncbi:kazal-like domain-containing protein [Trichonephila clavipes]|nr:kazal-like domain-containing protein [Trichonephila clavipes]
MHSLTCELANCRYGGVCDHDPRGYVHCVCSFHCSPLRDSVCGSDGRLYENECRLREESCRLQQNIQIVASENCGAKEVAGAAALVRQLSRDLRTAHDSFTNGCWAVGLCEVTH